MRDQVDHIGDALLDCVVSFDVNPLRPDDQATGRPWSNVTLTIGNLRTANGCSTSLFVQKSRLHHNAPGSGEALGSKP